MPQGLLHVLGAEKGLVHHLEGVLQDDLHEEDRGPGGVNGAPVAFAEELGQPPHVVQVGVGEEDGVHLLRVKAEGGVVPGLLLPLEHPAVQKDAPAPGEEEVGASRDLPGRPKRYDAHALILTLSGGCASLNPRTGSHPPSCHPSSTGRAPDL